MNLLHTKLRNRMKAEHDSRVFKRANRKRLEPKRTPLNLTPDQEIELEDEHLPSPSTSNMLGKGSRDSKDEEKDYLLGPAQLLVGITFFMMFCNFSLHSFLSRLSPTLYQMLLYVSPCHARSALIYIS